MQRQARKEWPDWARGPGRLLAALCSLVAASPLTTDAIAASVRPVRAAYFYGAMPASHIDSLARAGFDRALVKFSADSLDSAATSQIRGFAVAAKRTGVTLVPSFNLQSRARLGSLRSSRRYTWGTQLKMEPDVACPLDSAYWRSALLDHAEEFLGTAPDIHGLLLDLELYAGSLHHYDRGPCRCSACLAEYAGTASPADLATRDLPGLHAWEETRLAQILTPLLAELAGRHPGLELGVFDLDFDSFVHRALARALARSGMATMDYCEKTYAVGTSPVPAVRGRLTALGLGRAPIVGGLWLQKWAPRRLESGVAAMSSRAQGYFIFTSFSLWFNSARLTGPYTIPGSQADYWGALSRANRTLLGGS